MIKALPNGVWPTMLTPFTEKNEADFESLKHLVDWYIDSGVDGIFAVCQSSEMFFLSLEEKVKLAKATVEASAGRVPVIASGHTSDSLALQIKELNAMCETGIDAVVLVTNRLASETDSDDIFIKNLGKIEQSLPDDKQIGFYECPYPYKRLLSEKVLQYCIDSGRYGFLKDTSCSIDIIQSRIRKIKGSPMKLFNANSATLLDSLKAGGHGYSGVMANFHPDLYSLMLHSFKDNPILSKELQNLLGTLSALESNGYPLNAKYNLVKRGILKCAWTRVYQTDTLTENNRRIAEQMHELVQQVLAGKQN